MKKVILKESGQDVTPRVTEGSIYPDIDNSYTALSYEGERLVVPTSCTMGFKQLGTWIANKQGMAINGNRCVRMASSGDHYIGRISGNVITTLATFSAATGHSNSLQFAPTVLSGDTYPLLYVAGLAGKCYVLRITADYSVTIVQTLTISGSSSIAQTCNLQIGDDGHIWAAYLSSTNQFHFAKLRKVLLSEGDVTLTDGDIIDEWDTEELYPYSQYVWQGMKVKWGKVWLLYGTTTSEAKRGIVVYNTATHSLVAQLDLTASTSREFEDFDFYDGSLLVGCYSSEVYQLKF